MLEWIDNLRLDDKSEGYISSAQLALAHFSNFCAEEGLKHPDEIERHHILRYQAYLTHLRKENGDPFTLSYRQQLMKVLRNWINWLDDLDYITQNPWHRIRVGRTPKKPKPLEDEEIAALFDAHLRAAFSMSPFYYHRREVILVLLYGWGLRLHELTALSVSNMDMRLDFVTAINKGGGTKVLPYGNEMKDVVQRWLIQRGKNAVPEVDSLLIDSQGRTLSNKMVYKIITELGQRAGVQINPHRLRDSFGTKLLESDVPVERIMKMMGHTQRSQTLAYARVNDQTLKASHDEVMQPLIKKLLGGLPDEPSTRTP
jgi:site-specific recombinase XerD